jgi:hypothetical protein
MAGSRFFDCRVYLRSFPLKKTVNGKTVDKQKVPTLGHFAVDTQSGMGGGYGGSLVTVIRDAISFVRSNSSEFIILRFSHTKCTDEVGNVLKDIYDSHDNADYIFTGDVNIAQARVANLRGKVIMVFDSKFNKQRVQSYQVKKTLQRFRSVEYKEGGGLGAKGMHLFTKYKGGNAGNGLCTCGSFADSDDVKVVASESLKAAKGHRDHARDHLCFVYWQLTGGVFREKNVEGMTKNPETGTHAQMLSFIEDLLKECGNRLPNVISHDFVTEQSCDPIIRLNHDRSLASVAAQKRIGSAAKSRLTA